MARTQNGLAGDAPRDCQQLMGFRFSFDGVRFDPAGAHGQFEHADCAEQMLLTGRKPALLALSYLGTERTLPNYNTTDEVGNATAFMLPDLASAITAEIMWTAG